MDGNLTAPGMPTLIQKVEPAPTPKALDTPSATAVQLMTPAPSSTVNTPSSATAPPPIPWLASRQDSFSVVKTEANDSTAMEVDSSITQPDSSSTEKMQVISDSLISVHPTLASLYHQQINLEKNDDSGSVGKFLGHLFHLIHADHHLASSIWIDMFGKLWKILSRKQQVGITAEFIPFLCSGSHLIQRDMPYSALKTIFDACLAAGPPPMALRPFCIKYVGKSHRAWYEAVLALERYLLSCEVAADNSASKKKGASQPSADDSLMPFNAVTPSATITMHETVACLSELYHQLGELDSRCALWQKRAVIPESKTAISFYQHGYYDQARSNFEAAMRKVVEKHSQMAMNAHDTVECQLWEDSWVDCCKQLSLWQVLKDFCSPDTESNSQLLADVVWRLPDFTSMRENLSRMDINSCPSEWQWKLSVYQGYSALSTPPGSATSTSIDEIVSAASVAATGPMAPTYSSPTLVQRCAESAFQFLMRDWRRLPPNVVSPTHRKILQSAQQVIELNESPLVVQAFSGSHGPNTREQQHTVKTILKTWKNRLPLMTESMEHWSDIISWRQHNYRLISNEFAGQPAQQHGQNIVPDVQMYVGVHESCHTLIQFGRIARKHGNYSVCWEILDRIYTIPTIPVVDVFRRIRQQLKCYLQLGMSSGCKKAFQEGLEILDACKMQYFNKEMTAPLLAYRGIFLSQLEKTEEAQKSLSAAFQVDDPPSMSGAWGQWGELLENMFMKDRSKLYLAVNALCCFTHACRLLKPGKGRRFLARVLWLLGMDDQRQQNSLTETFSKRYASMIPSAQYAHWIPQFVSLLLQPQSGEFLVKTAQNIGHALPQQLYFPLRNIYMTKVNGSETSLIEEICNFKSRDTEEKMEVEEEACVKERILKILHSLYEAHPTFVSAAEMLLQGLKNISDKPLNPAGVAWRISQLRLEMIKLLYDSRGQDGPLPGQIAEQLPNLVEMAFAQLSDEWPSLFTSFRQDFSSDAMSHTIRSMLVISSKWCRLFDDEMNLRIIDPQTFQSRFLGNQREKIDSKLLHSSDQLSELEILGESAPGALVATDFADGGSANAMLNPSSSNAAGAMGIGGPFSRDRSHLLIFKILPFSDVIYRNGKLSRRVHILAANGKTYSYILNNEDYTSDNPNEDAVMQLERTLNPQFLRSRETARRGIRFSPNRVISVAPNLRAIEDLNSWCSLDDIWRLHCQQTKKDPDAPLNLYFDKLATHGQSTPKTEPQWKEIMKEVQTIVSRSILSEFAEKMFPDQTQYYVFRKRLTSSLAVASIAENLFSFTPVTPEMVMIDLKTGNISVNFHRFDFDSAKAELNKNHPVPFRLSPTLVDFMSPIGISGSFTACAVATARCLMQPNTDKIEPCLRLLLRVFLFVFIAVLFKTFLNRMYIQQSSTEMSVLDQK